MVPAAADIMEPLPTLEAMPPLCQDNAVAFSDEHGEAKFKFDILDRGGDGGLRNIQPFGCFTDGAAINDFHKIPHLLNCHSMDSPI